MSHPSAVTAPVQAASKSFPAASLGPLAGLLVGAAALSVSQRVQNVEDLLRAIGWGERSTHLVLGVSVGGALLAACVVGAMARGRRVPAAVLLGITGAVWLMGAALTFSDVQALNRLQGLLRLAEQAGMLSEGMPLAFMPRLIGAFTAAGVLLGAALTLGLSTLRSCSGGRLRSAVLGGLSAAPLLIIAGVAGLRGADALAWAHAGLGLLLVVTSALVAVAIRSDDDGAVRQGLQALWLGAVGMMVGCLALLAAAHGQVYGDAGNALHTLDRLFRLSWGAEQLGAMRWATGATLLVCGALAAGFTLVSSRREVLGLRVALGAVGGGLVLLIPMGADTLVGALAESSLSFEWRLRSVPPGFKPVGLPGANVFDSSAENTRPAAIHDADFIVVPGEARFSEEELFPVSVFVQGESLETDEGLQRLERQLGKVLPVATQRALREKEHTQKSAPALSLAVDARVPMRTLARLITAAHAAGAEGLFFVGRSADHDDPAVRDTLRTHVPSLEPVLDAPLGVSMWFAPPADERASERLVLRARLTGEGPFEVSPLEGEGPRFQVDPARQLFPHGNEPDTALGVMPEGPAPVVLLSLGATPEVSPFLRAAAALRARGFLVVLER